ncbi:MAG: NAD-dependent epimerase/dehydratase family protein [Gammaproteobacteria bacterium]|nr:MAG: NAD-dependent epimerase/dehydratase family protein [Gammaproteobacteria bacterium]
MHILIVGGTGLTGATAARHLASKGHQVTLMARHAPDNPLLKSFGFIQADYINDELPVDRLRGFDALVFAAGADLRMQPQGSDDSFFEQANTLAIPRFFAKAKAAGIPCAVYIGSYYPQVVPEKINTNLYVKSRHLADEGVRALNDASFRACSLNAPFILGHFPGVNAPHLQALVNYCAGRIPNLPLIAPAGGVNHISAQSMAEAIEGAIARGEPGKAYLVGDENLSWKTYLELFCKCAGNPQELAVTTDEHPMLPDIILYAGRNATVHYIPDNAPLNYSTGKIRQTIADVVAAWGGN